MTYGVYSSDLEGMTIGGLSLEEAKKYLWKRKYVVCSEREIPTGLKVVLHFHKWRKPRFCRWDVTKEFGFFSIEWRVTTYTWADKIVCRYEDVNKEVKE